MSHCPCCGADKSDMLKLCENCIGPLCPSCHGCELCCECDGENVIPDEFHKGATA
jgi:hypothetical protein